MALGLASLLLAMSANAAPLIAVDFHQNADDPIQDGFEAWQPGQPSAGSDAVTTTIGSYTVSVLGASSVLGFSDPGTYSAGFNARRRIGSQDDGGGFTQALLMRERLGNRTNQDAEFATGVGQGMYVKVEGLLANTAYSVTSSGNDWNGSWKSGSFYLFDAGNEIDGEALAVAGSYTVPATPFTTDESAQATGTITTDGAGTMIFKTTANIDRSTINGFSVTEIPTGITPPENLAGTTDGASVDLNWSDDLSGTVDFYTVKRGTSPGGPYPTVFEPSVTDSEFIDTTVVTGTTYYYVVTATDTEAPPETGPSNELEITPVIQAPTNLTAIPNDTVVALDWDDNTSGILASYSVYRSEFPGGPYETLVVEDLISSEYSDTDVTNEVQYFYVVTAFDNGDPAFESEDSAEISATPFTPVLGSSLYIHLDGSVEDSVVLDEFGPVAEKVITWEDLTGNFNDSSEGEETVLYPSATRSPTDLPGLDMGSGRNLLSFQSGVFQDEWLDFSNTGFALPYSGFAVLVAVTADDILGGINRDVVMSSVQTKFRLGYEAGRPQLLLNGVELEGPVVVGPGDTVILAVNYDVATETVEIWDSLSGTTSSATVPAGDFSENRPIYLGGGVNGDQYMSGMIGEVKVYRGAMTPAEFEAERLALNFKWAGLTAPAGLVATPGNTEVTLDWADQLADSYEINRDGELLVEGLLTSNYTDTGLTNGVTYEYTVTAIKDGEFSDESETVSATPFSPVATLYYHLDATDVGSVSVVNTNEVTEWVDLSGNAEFPAVPAVGTMLYPSSSLSPTNLAGLDAGFLTIEEEVEVVTKTTLLTFNGAEQNSWLDFTSPTGAQPYTGFTVFAVVKADSILGGNQRDVVMSSSQASFRLGYQGGIPEFWLNEGMLQNSPETQVIFAGDTVVLAVNYNAGTGSVELWDSATRSTSMTTVAAADFSNSASMFLGGSTNPDQYMDGMIGEVKIYRGVMTPSEFAAEQTALVTKWIGAPVGGFIGWQTANSTSEGLEGDHDLDGVQNGIEFFLGGDTNTTGFTPVPGVVDNGGTFSVTWNKALGYLGDYGTDFVVETSTTLDGEWSPVTEGDGVTIVDGEVTYTFPSPSGKLFVRLQVTGP
ncbi:LamG-like jellyroll fold domain-containing protein [Haloferula sp.]|uniref:LamG-like jellyroll fold domain-containing protein n=1 Tax=Haloferula sp. TaxID=2497595 RepID=UPI003C752A8B